MTFIIGGCTKISAQWHFS